MVTSINTRRLALVGLSALALVTGCTGPQGANQAGDGADATASEQATSSPAAPATPGGSQDSGVVILPPSAVGDQDSGPAPSGGAQTGAGGTAEGVNSTLLALGGLIAAGGAVALALRRRALG